MKKLFTIILCFMLFASACARPEVSDNTTETASTGSTAAWDGEADNSISDLQEDQGRVIEQTISLSEEKTLQISASVNISASTVEKGSVMELVPALEQIENVFTDGEKMVPGTENNSWFLPGDEEEDAAFRLVYMIDEDSHIARLDNSSTNSMYTEDTILKTEAECSDEELQVLDALTEEADAIFSKLGLTERVLEQNLYVTNEAYMAKLVFNPMIDGVSVLTGSINSYHFLETQIELNAAEVSSITFCGIEKERSESVSVISVDEMLEIISGMAERGDIDVLVDKIDYIDLMYYVDYEQKTFYPVWCLSSDLFGDGGLKTPCICINAETGALVY